MLSDYFENPFQHRVLETYLDRLETTSPSFRLPADALEEIVLPFLRWRAPAKLEKERIPRPASKISMNSGVNLTSFFAICQFVAVLTAK
jgi:hypothetical protein